MENLGLMLCGAIWVLIEPNGTCVTCTYAHLRALSFRPKGEVCFSSGKSNSRFLPSVEMTGFWGDCQILELASITGRK